MIGYYNSLFSVTRAILAKTASGTPVDPDAQAFITAAAITDPTQQSAINQLVVDLKGYNVWSKMKALYPFVGGTASSHKFNLKDPRDLDAAYRLVFSGGITHSSTGVKPNGTNGYADTKFIPSTPQLTSSHLSIYSISNLSTSTSIDIGCASGPSNRYLLTAGLSSITTPVLGFGDPISSYSTSNSLGFYFGTLNGNIARNFKNGLIQDFKTVAVYTPFAGSVSLFACFNNIGYYSPREIAFSSIGDGLSDTEAANFYTAVQTFNTTLNRQV